MNSKGLYFGIGFAVGGLVSSIITYVIVKDKIEKRCDEEIDAMREYYINSIRKEENDGINEKKDIPNEIKEALKRNYEKPPLKATLVEEEDADFPMEDHGDEDAVDPEEEKLLNLAEEARDIYTATKNDPPRMISEEEAANLHPSVESVDWTYFSEDSVMIGDDEQIVSDYKRFVGDTLDDWIFDNDSDYIIVMSYEFSTCYHISKLFKRFADTEMARNQLYEY